MAEERVEHDINDRTTDMDETLGIREGWCFVLGELSAEAALLGEFGGDVGVRFL